MPSDASPLDDKDLFDQLITLRRWFHQHPETGFKEFRTTARICAFLDRLDCTLLYGDQLVNRLEDPQEAAAWPKTEPPPLTGQTDEDAWIAKLGGRTGVAAIIRGGLPGPRIGFRFDIDGLPIHECREDDHMPFREGFCATNDNMHACGHDGHMATGLVLAKTLAENAAQLKGEYFLMFQPAEELISGGRIFSRFDFVRSLDYFFAIHIGLVERVKMVCGVSFLANKRYRVTFKGRCAHAGATPEQGRNALLAACAAITQLYAISRHSAGASRINVGNLSSDNAPNIISDLARFELDLRGESNEICAFLKKQAGNIIQGAATMHQVEAVMDFVTEAETAENAEPMIEQVKQAGLQIGILDSEIAERHLVSGSEDATFIMNRVMQNGGMACYIGLCSPTFGGHHNERFDFDEKVLPTGVRLLYRLARNIAEQH